MTDSVMQVPYYHVNVSALYYQVTLQIASFLKNINDVQ